MKRKTFNNYVITAVASKILLKAVGIKVILKVDLESHLRKR